MAICSLIRLLWAQGCVFSRLLCHGSLQKRCKHFFVKWLPCGNNINNYFLCTLLAVFKLIWTNISYALTLMVKYGLPGSSTSGNLFSYMFLYTLHLCDNELSHKETQCLFQWLSSSDCDDHILWYHFRYVCKTQVPRPLESQFTRSYRAASPACCGVAAFMLYISSMA